MKGTNLLEQLHKAKTDAEFERQKRKEIELKYNELLVELKKTTKKNSSTPPPIS